jgi:hypothetical protein
MWTNKTIALAAGMAAAFGSVAAADVTFGTDTPVADSSKEHPLELTIYNKGGNPITVTVTNIKKTDGKTAKAEKIVDAISHQTGFGAGIVADGSSSHVLVTGTNKVRVGADPTKEGFDTIKGDFAYSALFGINGVTVCSGLDPLGSASVLRMGILGGYISSLTPTSGQSASEILSFFAADLSGHGIAAQFDALNGRVTLAEPVSPSDTFVFGNSDTGIDSYAEVEVVPAPGSLAALAVFGLMARRRRR